MNLKTKPMRLCLLGFVAGSLIFGISATAEKPKNHDFDVIRDEAQAPPYHLPPVLVSAEGKAISTPEEWFNIRRPQILSLFGNLIYGVNRTCGLIRVENISQPTTPARCTDCWGKGLHYRSFTTRRRGSGRRRPRLSQPRRWPLGRDI